MMKSLVWLLLITTSIACKEKKDKDFTTMDEPSLIEEPKESASASSMVLKEDALNDFRLKKAMILEAPILTKHFPNAEIKKEIGQQDGPDYVYYTIDKDLVFSTPDTKGNVLSHITIKGNSKISDAYGIAIGNTLDDIKAKRSDIKIVTDHFRIYLHEEDSNISYEMSLTNYNGPDKENYAFDDIKDSKVIAILWGR